MYYIHYFAISNITLQVSVNCQGLDQSLGIPLWLSSKESTCKAGYACSNPDQEDPLEEGTAPTPILLPGESHGQRSLWAAVHRVAESLNDWVCTNESLKIGSKKVSI